MARAKWRRVGPGVTRFKTGDRVCGTFFQSWISGPMTERHPALGSPLDGTLAEYIVLHEDGVVAMPKTLSFEEAATLPCAGGHGLECPDGVGQARKARRDRALPRHRRRFHGRPALRQGGRSARDRHFFERREDPTRLRAGRLRRRQLQALPGLAERSAATHRRPRRRSHSRKRRRGLAQ